MLNVELAETFLPLKVGVKPFLPFYLFTFLPLKVGVKPFLPFYFFTFLPLKVPFYL